MDTLARLEQITNDSSFWYHKKSCRDGTQAYRHKIQALRLHLLQGGYPSRRTTCHNKYDITFVSGTIYDGPFGGHGLLAEIKG
jgi:hypothetical protein